MGLYPGKDTLMLFYQTGKQPFIKVLSGKPQTYGIHFLWWLACFCSAATSCVTSCVCIIFGLFCTVAYALNLQLQAANKILTTSCDALNTLDVL